MTRVTHLTDAVVADVLAFPSIEEVQSLFGPHPAWRAHGREIMHFDAEDLVDIRLTRREIRDRRNTLAQDPRITFRRSSSDWIRVTISSKRDVRFVVDLVRITSEASRKIERPSRLGI